MEAIQRLSFAVQNPSEIIPFLSRYGKSTLRLLQEGNVRNIPLLIEHAVGTEFFTKKATNDVLDRDVIRTDVFGNIFWVFADDRGLSRDLLIHGIREEKSTKTFLSVLRELDKEINDITVLEIGANIGYYAVLEADSLDSGQIFALEPETANFKLLEENINSNDFKPSITVEQAAISDEDGTAKLEISEHSNTHKIHDPEESTNSEIVNVKSYTIDGFLKDHNIDPHDVNVIRMDVEGYETEIIDQLDSVLDSKGEVVLFVELHHRLVGEREYKNILDKLDKNGFEPISAVYNTPMMPAWDGKRISADELSDLRELPEDANCVELIARNNN